MISAGLFSAYLMTEPLWDDVQEKFIAVFEIFGKRIRTVHTSYTVWANHTIIFNSLIGAHTMEPNEEAENNWPLHFSNPIVTKQKLIFGYFLIFVSC